MLAHLLEQEGIAAHIHGEALHGAAGDLPVANLVQLLVAEEDYARARELLLRWEKQNAAPAADAADAADAAKSFPVIAAVGFALVGAAFGWLGKSMWDSGRIPIDSAVQELDQNGDGRADYTYFYRGVGLPAYKTEGDFDFDGRIDYRAFYDNEGVPQRDERDNNFDGVIETQTSYRSGNAVRSDVDTDGDGQVDMRVHYRHGVVDREEISDPQTGRVARVNYYENSLLHRAETDLDRDGSLETVTLYDRFGQPTPGK